MVLPCLQRTFFVNIHCYVEKSQYVMLLKVLTKDRCSSILYYMVERNAYLDGIFGALADPTRRDILRRLMSTQYTVSQIAQDYQISFAAVAKHLNVLEKAQLVMKKRRGKEQVVSIVPQALKDASYYLAQYEALWNYRFEALDQVLKEDI